MKNSDKPLFFNCGKPELGYFLSFQRTNSGQEIDILCTHILPLISNQGENRFVSRLFFRLDTKLLNILNLVFIIIKSFFGLFFQIPVKIITVHFALRAGIYKCFNFPQFVRAILAWRLFKSVHNIISLNKLYHINKELSIIL